MKELAELIRTHPFVAGLDESVVDLIAGCAKNVVYKPWDYIFREGEDAHSFYLVREGAVALEMYTPGRGAFSFLTVGKGEILGYSSLVKPYRVLYDARVIDTTRLLAFDHHCLLDKCESDHQVGYEILQRIIEPLIERLQAARIQSINLYVNQSA